VRTTVDAVVVGGGLAGFCAAISAAEHGAEVVLLEKLAIPGGSTSLSGGFFAFAETDMQKGAGIDDSAQALEHDLIEVGEHKNDLRLVRAYADQQAEHYRWLVDHGVRFTDVELSSGQSAARSHRADPGEVITVLRRSARRLEVAERYECPVERLALDSSGAVRGISLAGGEEIRVRGGVVLASGGFARNKTMLEKYAPLQKEAIPIGAPGNVGDGITMALQAGARLIDTEFIKGTFGTHAFRSWDGQGILLTYYRGAIIVNGLGRRFVDESLGYKLLGDACLRQPGAIAYQVFDNTVHGKSSPGVPLFDSHAMREKGLLVSAPTLEELAGKVGIDPAALRQSVDSYNSAIGSGGTRDEFGREYLCFNAGQLVPLVEPPFFAFPSTTALLATYCGLMVDPEAHVLDGTGAAIAGLFAAGELTGGFHGAGYMTGSSLGKASLFGRRAGANAARRASHDNGGSDVTSP
jgi:fumarate reductase flavoprotein subunit